MQPVLTVLRDNLLPRNTLPSMFTVLHISGSLFANAILGSRFYVRAMVGQGVITSAAVKNVG